MNGRRQLLGAVGLGSLLAGVTAVVPGERFAATAKPRPTGRPIPPDQRAEYKVFTVAAGDSVEEAFNAVAREGGFVVSLWASKCRRRCSPAPTR